MPKTQESSVARHLAAFVPAALIVLGLLVAGAWAFWATINMIVWSASEPSLFNAPEAPPAALIVTAAAVLAAGFVGAAPHLIAAIWEYTKPSTA